MSSSVDNDNGTQVEEASTPDFTHDEQPPGGSAVDEPIELAERVDAESAEPFVPTEEPPYEPKGELEEPLYKPSTVEEETPEEPKREEPEKEEPEEDESRGHKPEEEPRSDEPEEEGESPREEDETPDGVDIAVASPDESLLQGQTETVVLLEPSNNVESGSKPRRRFIKRPILQSVKKHPRMATSVEDITSYRFWKAVLAEFIGTMFLVLIGCGSCVSLKKSNVITSAVVQIALCFGLSVGTIIWVIAHVSGGNINPAVTAALLVTRKISLARAFFYVLFQMIGAIVGSALLFAFTPKAFRGSLGATVMDENLSVGQAVGVEIFITFVLIFVVFACCDKRREDLGGSFPLAIGLSITMCHLFAIEYTGSGMNPARSFGPAVVMDIWDDHWVYWVGPLIGGIAAGLLYDHVFAVNASLSKTKACVLNSHYDENDFRGKKMKVRVLEEDSSEEHKEDQC